MEQLYNDYDKMAQICFINIWGMSKDKQEIVLTNFDVTRKDHLCVLKIAGSISQVYNFPVTIELGLFRSLKAKRMTGEKFYHKKNIKDTSGAIDVQNMIEFMENSNNLSGIFSKIYEEFYERKQ